MSRLMNNARSAIKNYRNSIKIERLEDMSVGFEKKVSLIVITGRNEEHLELYWLGLGKIQV